MSYPKWQSVLLKGIFKFPISHIKCVCSCIMGNVGTKFWRAAHYFRFEIEIHTSEPEIFFIPRIGLPFQSLVRTLPTMQLSCSASSLRAVYQITCSSGATKAFYFWKIKYRCLNKTIYQPIECPFKLYDEVAFTVCKAQGYMSSL